jgi:hypothetical protein
MLTGCTSLTNKYTTESEVVTLKHSYSRLAVKDYDIKGIVYTQATNYCFLAGLFCSQDIFIHDSLMKQAEKIGANHIINMVADKNISSPFWYLLFAKHTYRANALAVKLTKTERNIVYGFSE